jgi:putative nucleotidyltransferase with HDIG domain
VPDKFSSVDIEELLVGEDLPVSLYVYINFRFITFRAAGDIVDRATYERLELKKVKNLFVQDRDREAFGEWSRTGLERLKPPAPATPEAKEFSRTREDAHRKLYDIFQAEHPDRDLGQALDASKRLVEEVMKFQFAVQSLAQLQSHSRGTVDHCVNVSTLSVYLAMQMGYSHNLILQHVGAGALLHDIGKLKVKIADDEEPADLERKMKEHPALGAKLLDAQPKVPNEVKMIVAQHHEAHDGTGYPRKLRGSAIYDLARIVSIANLFDELVGDGKGPLVERQRLALTQLDQVHFKKFDPQKLDKALKILRLGV